ncbi:MAG: hypothetical protein DRI36_02945 [Caldiserica bacterium]|nr:MAG: hypothetical protein DRI36_02945 [Caldisericota bacterium]
MIKQATTEEGKEIMVIEKEMEITQPVVMKSNLEVKERIRVGDTSDLYDDRLWIEHQFPRVIFDKLPRGDTEPNSGSIYIAGADLFRVIENLSGWLDYYKPDVSLSFVAPGGYKFFNPNNQYPGIKIFSPDTLSSLNLTHSNNRAEYISSKGEHYFNNKIKVSDGIISNGKIQANNGIDVEGDIRVVRGNVWVENGGMESSWITCNGNFSVKGKISGPKPTGETPRVIIGDLLECEKGISLKKEIEISDGTKRSRFGIENESLVVKGPTWDPNVGYSSGGVEHFKVLQGKIGYDKGYGVNAVYGLRTGEGDGIKRIDSEGNLVNIKDIYASGNVEIKGDLVVKGKITPRLIIRTGWFEGGGYVEGDSGRIDDKYWIDPPDITYIEGAVVFLQGVESNCNDWIKLKGFKCKVWIHKFNDNRTAFWVKILIQCRDRINWGDTRYRVGWIAWGYQ